MRDNSGMTQVRDGISGLFVTNRFVCRDCETSNVSIFFYTGTLVNQFLFLRTVKYNSFFSSYVVI